MKVFFKTSFFIFVIVGYFNPIFSFQDIKNNDQNKQKKSNINLYIHLLTSNSKNPKNKDFILKDIPDFSIEKLKKSIKQNKDPFGDNILSKESSSFEDLYMVLVGLFKINDKKNAMFVTKDGIKNYMIGDKIEGDYIIKDIDLISKEVLITDGEEQKFYKFPEK